MVENNLPLTTTCHVNLEIVYLLSHAQVPKNYKLWRYLTWKNPNPQTANKRTGQPQTKNHLNTLDFIWNSSSNGDSNGHDH